MPQYVVSKNVTQLLFFCCDNNMWSTFGMNELNLQLGKIRRDFVSFMRKAIFSCKCLWNILLVNPFKPSFAQNKSDH